MVWSSLHRWQLKSIYLLKLQFKGGDIKTLLIIESKGPATAVPHSLRAARSRGWVTWALRESRHRDEKGEGCCFSPRLWGLSLSALRGPASTFLQHREALTQPGLSPPLPRHLLSLAYVIRDSRRWKTTDVAHSSGGDATYDMSTSRYECQQT